VEEELAPHRRGTLVVRRFDEVDRQVRVVGTTGVTLVLADLEGQADGRPFDVRLRISRAWVHTGGRWRVLSAHRSLAPVPAAVVRDDGSGPAEDEPFDGDGEAFVLI
jgi:hypothetical protein